MSSPSIQPPPDTHAMAKTGVTPPAVQISRPLRLHQRLWQHAAVRKLLILLLLAAGWEIYARHLDSPLMVPTFSATAAAWYDSLVHGQLLSRVLVSLKVLAIGYAAGLVIATVLTTLAITTRLGSDLLDTLTAMLNPLPAIALLPLALLWFGLGTPSIVFVLIHAVLWPIALSTYAGFSGVAQTLRMAGRNYGLGGPRFVWHILIPAAMPSILTGLRNGWAFAWRTLIAAELVFGVSSGSGGLGWFIYENKTQLETAYVFAGLATVVLIGLAVEGLLFRVVENWTVRRWGMKN